ncbi:MAG: CAP domain-containing protein [Dehalococcoidia bacterium]
MRYRRLFVRLAALAALVALGAAGLYAGAASPALAGPNCTVAPADAAVDGAEQEMLGLINQHRTENGQPALSFSSTLNKTAAWKSKHMADQSYFAHDDTPINRTWVQRFRDCNYTFNTWIGENIAAGNETAPDTYQQWLNSPGHNANMLNGHYTVIGIGRAYNASAPYDWYWTTEFGGYDDGYTPPVGATATPTPAPPPGDVGAPGVRMPGTTPDNDGDGCSDARERGSDLTQGGQLDPNNYWDFFDVPNDSNSYDGTISLNDDIFGVMIHWSATDDGGRAAINRNTDPLSPQPLTGYHPAFDRSPAPPGAPAWQLGPPDGQIDLFTDIFGVAFQFGTTCN